MPRPTRQQRPARLRDETKNLFRRAVLDAAEEVFAEKGVRGARMQDIADRARIAVGTIYNHFAQKEDLLAALLAERDREIHDALERRPEDPERFEPQLRARLGRVFAFLARHRDFFRISVEQGFLGDDHQHHRREEVHVRSTVMALLEQGIAEGALAARPVPSLARFFAGGLKNTLLGALLEKEDLETAGQAGISLFLEGARRP